MQQVQSERAHSVAFLVLCTLAGLSSACGERRLDGNEYQGAQSALYGAAGAAADSYTVGAVCGGLLGLRCGPGEYCNFAPEARCGRADATGTCARKPVACTRDYRPVCGCDGITYGNPCMAAAAGMSVEHRGACEVPGEVCGGLLGIGCPDGQYCDLAAGDGCDVSDAQGICTDQPQFCSEQVDPVCGCDGVTYGNACFAAASGASVRAPGRCYTSR